MKSVLILALGVIPAFAQGFGQREMMQLWMRGGFAAAELNFAKVQQGTAPTLGEYFLSWEADYEIERGRYGAAASLLEEAKRFRTRNSEDQHLLEKRLARLNWSVGKFSEAEKLALQKQSWKNEDVRKLDLPTMNLVTLGEVYLARGRFQIAIQILEKACTEAKKSWKTDSPEWIRAQNDIATADMALDRLPAASDAASYALAAAEKEWGSGSIPYLDALDCLGMVDVSGSKLSDAERALSESRAGRERLYGGPHPKIAASYLHAAALRAAQKDDAGALQFLMQGLDMERALAVGGPNGQWALSMLAGADLLARIGHSTDAHDLYTSAIPILETELGENAPRVQDARRRFADRGTTR